MRIAINFCSNFFVSLYDDISDWRRQAGRQGCRSRLCLDSAQAAAKHYRHYYIPAERMYDAEVDPRSHADVIVDNRDVADPVLRHGRARRTFTP
jgi:hypothetical protein